MATSAMAGWVSIFSSVSRGYTFEPPEMYMSEDRPVMYRKPSWSMWPKIAGPEPAIPERFRVRLGVVVVAREHRWAADANLARLKGRQLAAVIVLDRDLHPGALDAARSDFDGRGVFSLVQGRRQNRDVPGHLAQPKILDEHLAQLP